MCLIVETNNYHKEMSKLTEVTRPNSIDHIVKRVLLRAQLEKRVVIGLSDAVKSLNKSADNAVFCFIAPPKKGDSATLMHEVLLEAFCFENDIYIVKVDSPEKLSRLLGTSTLEACALVSRTWNEGEQREILTRDENMLIDHCENFWDAPVQPIVRLPDK